MSELSLVAPGQFALAGVINKTSVPDLVDSGWNIIARSVECSHITIDLSAVHKADSAALAMLLAWLRKSRHNSFDLAFQGVPVELLALARVCGLDEMLALDASIPG